MTNKQTAPNAATQTDVLIVGCGPVGATLASLLGRYGIRTLVIDKSPDILMMPRAIALDNEALRVLQMAGLGEDAFARIPIPEVQMHSPVMGCFCTANTRGSLDGHPKLVTFYQPELEQALARTLDDLPSVTVWRRTELINMHDDGNTVLAQVQRKTDGLERGQQQTIRARYLVGADGASSLVRSLIGQDFHGKTYGEDWLIVDACQRERAAIGHVEFICDPKRSVPHMPAPGGRERWEFMLHCGETREQMERPEKIAELMAPWAKGQNLQVERTAVYRFHARCCERFSKGRVFLVGDAAHITPPFVGQGLVAGLRDVANLGWKLAWVIQGLASEQILASYDQERRPHALKMITLARLMGHLVMTRNKASALLVHGLMRSARLISPLRRYLEELRIKPANRYGSGLFQMRQRQQGLTPGAQLAQGWVRHNNRIQLSDDALGDRLLLVGFGIDPRDGLSEQEKLRWQTAGGGFFQFGVQNQAANDGELAEDLNQSLAMGKAQGSLAVVRPDKFIVCSGGAGSSGLLLQHSLDLLGK